VFEVLLYLLLLLRWLLVLCRELLGLMWVFGCDVGELVEEGSWNSLRFMAGLVLWSPLLHTGDGVELFWKSLPPKRYHTTLMSLSVYTVTGTGKFSGLCNWSVNEFYSNKRTQYINSSFLFVRLLTNSETTWIVLLMVQNGLVQSLIFHHQ